MKVITIKQPWASLIANGYKIYEFRTWRTKFRGEILIHAGKGIDKKFMKLFEHLNLDYPSGCIIAKANIVDCIKVDEEFRNKINNLVYKNILDDISYDGYAFKLDNIKKISPININGKLSLWDYDYEEK